MQRLPPCSPVHYPILPLEICNEDVAEKMMTGLRLEILAFEFRLGPLNY